MTGSTTKKKEETTKKKPASNGDLFSTLDDEEEPSGSLFGESPPSATTKKKKPVGGVSMFGPASGDLFSKPVSQIFCGPVKFVYFTLLIIFLFWYMYSVHMGINFD